MEIKVIMIAKAASAIATIAPMGIGYPFLELDIGIVMPVLATELLQAPLPAPVDVSVTVEELVAGHEVAGPSSRKICA